MHQTQCTRLLIWSFCLYFAQGEVCSETELTGIEFMDITWNNCDGAQWLKLFKNSELHNGREYFSGIDTRTYASRYLFFDPEYTGFWGIGSGLSADDFVYDTARVQSSSLTVPDEVYWNQWTTFCNDDEFATNMQYTRSNCYGCGLNKITTPDSNICQCRAGQTPGNDGIGTCVNCPINTFKFSISDAACSLCGTDTTSPAGSTSFTDCVCGLNKITAPGSNICQCRAGQTQGYDAQGTCENCPINTYKESISDNVCSLCDNYATSPAGSTSLSDCVCLLRKIRPAGSYICQCSAGQSPSVVDGACVNCQTDTYKDSPSDAACTSCVDYASSLAGSTSVSDCLCNPGFTKTGDGTCTPCESGTFKQGVSDDDCTPCPENTFSAVSNIATACTACPENSISAAGSSTSKACQCKDGFSGENGGVCSMCGGGKYSVST